VNSRAAFVPPLSWETVLLIAAAIGFVWVLMRFAFGRPVDVARRIGLLLLRGAILAVVALILMNPVWVDEGPGKVSRPDVFLLLDGSQSMAIGKKTTRWEQSQAFMEAAQNEMGDVSLQNSLHLFRFGHRLTAVDSRSAASGAGKGQMVGRASPADSSASGLAAVLALAPPTDTDTRLAEALRQLTSRFGRHPPAAVVLFSDGRARDMNGVLELARLYGKQHVPVHVFLAGDTTSGGDIALVSLVAPQQVRKYSTVDVQVFLRSFGYDGERVEVKILAESESGGPPNELAAAPITLRSGVQSATLTYRTEMRKRRTRVVVTPKDDELSTRNNELDCEVGISRTKVRVLYIEGSSEPLRAVRRGDQTVQIGPHTPVQEALAQDEDIECVPLVAHPTLRSLVRISTDNAATARGFPATKAELFAFDALILSNVRREFFTDEQIEWIEQWISSRGGGLCMVGGPGSFSHAAGDSGSRSMVRGDRNTSRPAR
jgi:hypothetical protein